MIDLLLVREAIEASWDYDTTYNDREWSDHNPADGQCAVTSLVIQDYFGGELMEGVAHWHGQTTRHFWNRLEGLDLDFTWQQFPPRSKVRQVKKSTREELLFNEWTRQRYTKLAERTREYIKKSL